MERDVPRQLEAQHDHARDPEEDDVVAGLHDRSGVVAVEIRGGLGPTERRERPQARAEPRVEDVGVLDQALGRPAACLAGRGAVGVFGDGHVAVRAVPGRDPVAPPELAAHVPVPDAREPVLPDLLEPLGQDPDAPAPARLERARREGLGADEPLGLETRLHDVVRALAAPEHELVRSLAFEVAERGEVLEDAGPGREPIQSGVGTRDGVERSVVLHHVDGRQAVPVADLEVGGIVGGSHLHGTRPEGAVHGLVGHDGHVAVHERDPHAPAHERGVARVLGMHRHARVAQDRLGPGGGHGDPRGRVGCRRCLIDQVVAERPDRPLGRRRDHLEVGQARPAARAPVDERLGPVGQPGSKEPRERVADRRGAAIVHRVAEPAPVRRRTDPPLLAEHHRLRGIREGAHALEVSIAPE